LVTIPPLAPLDPTRIAEPSVTRAAGATTASAPAQKSQEAFRQFEAFVLQSFIAEMLPKSAEMVFGRGTAGAIWKSMLAEKLAGEIARSGRLGIAQKIAGSAGAQPPAAPAAIVPRASDWTAVIMPAGETAAATGAGPEPSGERS
jgi:hypothetical protein